jgi:hypothetical protein
VNYFSAMNRKEQLEIFTVIRRPDIERVEICLTDPPGRRNAVLSELGVRGLVIQSDATKRWILEDTRGDMVSDAHFTWETIHARMWPVLFAHGFQLKEEAENKWVFDRIICK